MIDRRAFLAGAAAMALPIGTSMAQSHPRNIVVVFVDDLFSIEHYRHKFGVRIYTPNFDRLMARGVSFMNAFCTTALCGPSRTSILTGMNPFKTGIHYNYDRWEDRVSPEDMLFASLKQAGYYTCSFGKSLHSYGSLKNGPLAPYLNDAFNAPLMNDVYGADTTNVSRAIMRMKFLPAHTPYFMAIGIYDPHVAPRFPGDRLPFAYAERFKNPYPLSRIRVPTWEGDDAPNWALPWLRRGELLYHQREGTLEEYVQGYLANVSEMDSQLGRIINNLDRWGRNPIIILTSDHGYTMGEHDHIGKFTLWDEAGRAPLIVVDPQGPAGVRHHGVVSLLDIAPTIMEYAGLAIPERMDGESLVPLIHSPSSSRAGGALTSMFNAFSLREDRYRFTRYPSGEEEFFDVQADPQATRNLVGSNTLPVYAMRDRLAEHVAQWQGNSPQCSVTMADGTVESLCQ